MAGENEANFRICSRASEVLSYMPCPLQYTKPSNQNGLWVFWSQHNDEFLTVHPTTADTTVYHDTIKEKITIALKNAYISDYFGCWLIQFWAPVTTKDQIFLTTCDLPFGLSKLHEGLCLYRSECLKFRIPLGTDYSANEYQLGPTGRVFKHGLPEMSPDVSRYSITDYPQLGLTLTAGLGNYLALPIFEPLSTQCTGVLEIIGDKKGSFSHELVQMIYEMLKKVDLRSANMYDHPDKKRFKGLERALKEIEEQLNFICRTHQLPLAQTWLPILNGSNIERFMTIKEQFCIYTSAGYEFKAACDMFHLRKMQGVVGRAFLSRNSCFCSDITKLRMSEYPLAHVAHKVGLYSSFAICLQSSYTGDYVYLLEFFLPKDNKSDCRSPQTKLNMLLATMKRQFRSFKLASGRELGERLLVEVIPVYSDDGFNCFEICIQNVKHSSDVEAIASRKKILWLDKLSRLLNGGNTVNTCPENIDVTSSTTSANTITKVRNLSFQANISVCTSSEEERLNNVPEGQYRVNSIVLQQEVGAKVNGSGTTPGRLANHLLPNTCGREHHELNDMNCSSNQLDSAKTADRLLEETSGSDHTCHDTTASSAHATSLAIHLHKQSTIQRKRSNSFNSDFPVGDPERSAKVSKIDTSSITKAIKFCPRKAELRRELQSKAIHERRSSSSPIFRLGPRLADSFEGIGVGEAKATELYKKHHPPTLSDEVWRLENIGKDGAFHRRLHRERNDTVKDSLTDAAQSADQVPEDPPRPLTRNQAKLLHDFDIHLAWLGGNMSSDDWPNTRTEGYTYKFEPEDNVTGHRLLAPDNNPPGHLNCVRRQVRANDDCVRADPLASNTSIVSEGK